MLFIHFRRHKLGGTLNLQTELESALFDSPPALENRKPGKMVSIFLLFSVCFVRMWFRRNIQWGSNLVIWLLSFNWHLFFILFTGFFLRWQDLNYLQCFYGFKCIIYKKKEYLLKVQTLIVVVFHTKEIYTYRHCKINNVVRSIQRQYYKYIYNTHT